MSEELSLMEMTDDFPLPEVFPQAASIIPKTATKQVRIFFDFFIISFVSFLGICDFLMRLFLAPNKLQTLESIKKNNSLNYSYRINSLTIYK
jgi:hypothetical protein